MNENRNEWAHFLKIGITVFLTFACCILLFFVFLRFETFAGIFSKMIKSAQPIIIGLVLAYLLNPIMLFVEDAAKRLLQPKVKSPEKLRKASRAVGVIGALLFLFLILGLLIAAVVPSVVNSVSSLIDTLPGYVQSAMKMVENGKFGDNEYIELASTYIISIVNQLEDWAQNTLLPQAQKYLAQITSGVISVVKAVMNFIVGAIVMIYVMTIQEKLTGQSKKLLYAICSPRTGNKINEIVRKASEIFGGFITGKILDSAIIGIICYVGCAILKIPDAILVAVIIGVTNVIPVFGPFIGAVPAILLVVIQSPIHALYLLIFIIVLQQVDGNIIGPKILGSSTGLSSFWVMCAILIGGGMFGFLGMLLGVPVFAVIYYVAQQMIDYVMTRKKLSIHTDDYIHLLSIDSVTNEMIYEEDSEMEDHEEE